MQIPLKLYKDKDIEVLIKVPKKWLETNELDFLSMLGGRVKNKVKSRLIEKATEEILKKIDLPKIKISSKEVKDRMLDILSDRALGEREP